MAAASPSQRAEWHAEADPDDVPGVPVHTQKIRRLVCRTGTAMAAAGKKADRGTPAAHGRLRPDRAEIPRYRRRALHKRISKHLRFGDGGGEFEVVGRRREEWGFRDRKSVV